MMIQMTSKPYTQESPDTAGVVYIVEDDEAVRDSLKWLLEASSYRVELFESGEMFLAKFDPNAIAVLVLDVRMPGMSGLKSRNTLSPVSATFLLSLSPVTATFRWQSPP